MVSYADRPPAVNRSRPARRSAYSHGHAGSAGTVCGLDVKADAPIPGPYGTLSLGMAVAGRPDLTFYTEIRPIF